MVTGMRGYDYVESVLKDNLGMTDEEITVLKPRVVFVDTLNQLVRVEEHKLGD